MTAATVSLPAIPGTPEESQTSSSDWDALPDAETENPPLDNTDVLAPPKGHCHGCGDPVIREPGARGRTPKYHEECRPERSTRSSAPRRDSRMSKLEQQVQAEADAAIEGFRKGLVKVALMVSIVDTYDAMCIMVQVPEICANLRGLLVRYDWLRREFLAVGTGGSILGLIVSVLMMALPILAHHGIISHKRISAILINSPFVMKRIAERVDEGEEALTRLMADQVRQKAEADRRRAQATQAATVDGSK